jgi:hypothetical protein
MAKSGKHSRRRVLSGTALKTAGGLTASDLKRNKSGRIVSRKKSARAASSKNRAYLRAWRQAVQQAADRLGVDAVVAPRRGTPLYIAARRIYDAM